MRRNHDKELLFNRLKKNLDFKSEKRVFSKHFGSFIWFLTDAPDKIPPDFQNLQLKACTDCKSSQQHRKRCISRPLAVPDIQSDLTQLRMRSNM